MASTELTRYNAQSLILMPGRDEITDMLEMAKVLVVGGFLPPAVKSYQAAFTIMLKGRELNIPPMEALNSINVIQGKPSLSAQLMQALVLRQGHYITMVETNGNKCVVKGRRKGAPLEDTLSLTWTLEMARQAGLSGGNWAKYPDAMLRSRAISALCRALFPDVLAGMYTAEELGADVIIREDGTEEVIAPASATVTVDTVTEVNAPAFAATVAVPSTPASAYTKMTGSELADWFTTLAITPAHVARYYQVESLKVYSATLKQNGDKDPLRSILRDFLENNPVRGWTWDAANGEPVRVDESQGVADTEIVDIPTGEVIPSDMPF